MKKKQWKLGGLQGWAPAVTHVAYLQIDCARGLLRACAGKTAPLIFAPHKGWKGNASPLVHRSQEASFGPLTVPFSIIPPIHRRRHSTTPGDCDHELQVCDGFIIDVGGGVPASNAPLHPLAHQTSCIAIIIFEIDARIRSDNGLGPEQITPRIGIPSRVNMGS